MQGFFLVFIWIFLQATRAPVAPRAFSASAVSWLAGAGRAIPPARCPSKDNPSSFRANSWAETCAHSGAGRGRSAGRAWSPATCAPPPATVGLPEVALRAGGDHVLPGRDPALRARNDMVERQVLALAAILAGEAIAQEHVEPGEGGEAGRLHVAFERHHRGQPHLEAWAAHQRVVLGDDVDPVEEHRLDRVLPAPD